MEMEENKETVQDILNEIRELSRSAKDGIIAINGNVIAERLETAWRNEAKEIEVNASPLPCVVIKHGNAAAMRKALSEAQTTIARCLEILDKIPDSCGYGGFVEDVGDELCCLRDEYVKPALSAPARNCDVYSSYGDAIRAFDELEEAEEYEDVAEWLFATATKGGAE